MLDVVMINPLIVYLGLNGGMRPGRRAVAVKQQPLVLADNSKGGAF